MKKITFNALLNHKAHNYKPMQIEVEKVIPLYGKRFEQMKNHPLDDCPEIIENRELQFLYSSPMSPRFRRILLDFSSKGNIHCRSPLQYVSFDSTVKKRKNLHFNKTQTFLKKIANNYTV